MGSSNCCKLVRTTNNNNYINCSKWKCEMNQFGFPSPESISHSYYSICRENYYYLWRLSPELHFHLDGYIFFSFLLFAFHIFLTRNLFVFVQAFVFIRLVQWTPISHDIHISSAKQQIWTKMKYHDILNLATILKLIFLFFHKTIFLFNFDLMLFYLFNFIFAKHFMPLKLYNIDIIHLNCWLIRVFFPSILRYRNMKVSYRWFEIVSQCAKKRVRIIL